MNTPIHWAPRYTLSASIAAALMEIEAARAVVEALTLPVTVQAELRRRARLRATHYSTRIEGNRLTLAETEQVIAGERIAFHGRERDVHEVQNYWKALLRIEEWASQSVPLTEDLIRKVHALVEKGARARPTPYRDGQNVIRDSISGQIIYLPPAAEDVPALMAALVAWARQAEREGVPAPLVAGLMHYQFVTVHPFYDGNGRTARLLATFILHRGGYGLNGFFSLEEYHAQDLEAYYRALAAHPHHNYYEGRAQADLTPWLAYFVETVARVFRAAQAEVQQVARPGLTPAPEPLRQLDHRARIVLGLFGRADQIRTAEVAEALGLSERMARDLLRDWVAEGWLVIADPSNKNRRYALAPSLSAVYRQYIGGLSAVESGQP